MKFELEEYHRGITDDELIADLKRVASEFNKNSLTRDDYDEKGKYGKTTYLRRFGSWFNALEKAGLEKTRTPMNVSKEELYKNLEEVWVRLGRQPRYEEVHKPFSKYHVGTYENRFGTWRKALQRFVSYINKEDAIPSKETLTKIVTESEARHKSRRNINWRLRFM